MTAWPPELLELLRDGAPLLVLTGAGVSAESGLATFRGPEGLWEGRDPSELATAEAFARDPEAVWRFYGWRRGQAAAAAPNAAHRAIAALERDREGFLLVTQNVDGLHERSGSRQMVRLHGTLWRLRCTNGCGEVDDRDVTTPVPRHCRCSALLRPAVVWFGEPLPMDALAAAERAARAARLVLVVGTSSLVYPAAAIPRVALAAGARVAEINPEATSLSLDAHWHLQGPAARVLPELLAAAGPAAGAAAPDARA